MSIHILKLQIGQFSRRFFAVVLAPILAALIVVSIVSIVPSSSFAQGTSAEKPPSGGPRRQLGTIIYAGLGGAVLGLSTLSFYGRPQDKLANIAIGFAIGVMAGTVAVTYSAATNPDDFYGSERQLGPAVSMTVLTAASAAQESAPAFSAAYELATF